MDKVILSAEIREEFGKEANKKLRNSNIVPAVAYKKGKETVSLKVDGKELFHILHTSAGENVIITLKVKDSAKDRTVIIKDIQYDHIRGDVLHVDFHEISLTEKITVSVPIETKGEPEGVKVEGGVLDHPMKDVQVECLPTEIPEKIDIHVEELKINDSIKVSDLELPEGVKVLSDPEATVVSVMPPRAEEEETEEEALEGESQEPEVIREKKPEEGEGQQEAAPAPEPEAKEEKKE